jgi:hypothetical protein
MSYGAFGYCSGPTPQDFLALIPVPTLQTWLTNAINAYTNIQMGTNPVEVRDQNGETVRFNTGNSDKLMVWIRTLNAAIQQRGRGFAGPKAPYGYFF